MKNFEIYKENDNNNYQLFCKNWTFFEEFRFIQQGKKSIIEVNIIYIAISPTSACEILWQCNKIKVLLSEHFLERKWHSIKTNMVTKKKDSVCSWKLSLFNSLIVFPVSVISLEIKRNDYFWNDFIFLI